jgi:hypothetical protein
MLNIASVPTTTQLRTAMESHLFGQANLLSRVKANGRGLLAGGKHAR